MRVFPRRDLLRIGALGTTGVGLPASLAAAATSGNSPRPKSCILLYMDGGPSHIDLFDMKPEAPAEIRGPFRPISTRISGLQICEHLPSLARQMQRVALVRSVTHEQTVHDPAVYQMLTGCRHVSTAGGLKVEPDDAPHMGAAFLRVSGTSAVMPQVVETPETMKTGGRILPGQNGGFLGTTYDPFRIDVTMDGEVVPPEFGLADGISLPRPEGRAALLDAYRKQVDRIERTAEVRRFDDFQRQAVDILRARQVVDAFDLDREPPAVQDRYGRHRQGRSTLLARRLVEAGARFVTVYWGHEDQDWADGKGPRPANNPWDTHRNHFPLVKETLAPRADQAFAALLDDLSSRGLLDDCLVVWMGDFGRTPRITERWASRDHWPHAFSLLMAGGGVRPGCVHGATDGHAAYVQKDPVTPADLTATIFDLLGIDPHANVTDSNGRPHPISKGRPICEVLT